MEENTVIAEFMGSEPNWAFQYEKEGYRFYINPWSSKATAYDDNLKENGFYLVPTCVFRFHNSWDWLMPVVEKIEALDICERFDINRYDVYIWAETFDLVKCRICFSYGLPIYKPDFQTKIEAIYTAVIEFIKWYNQSL